MGILYYILITALALGFFALAVRNLKSAIFVLVAILPSYLLRLDVFGVPTTLLELCFIGLFAAWLWKRCWKELHLSDVRPWVFLALALVFAGAAGVLTAGLSGGSWLESLNTFKSFIIEPVLFAGVLLSTLKKKSDWMELLLVLCVPVILLSLVAAAQVWLGLPIPSPWDFELRATSIYPFPNALGLYLAPLAAIGASLAFMQRSRLWLFLSVLAVFGCILAQTEAALVAIPAALAITAIIVNWKKPKLRFILIGGFIALSMVALIIPQTRSKLLLQDFSGQVRLSQWTETKDLLLDKPVFGAGLSNYPTAFEPYHQNGLYEIFQYPHNLVLNAWVELGFLGVLILASLLFLLARATKLQKTPLWVGLFAGLLTMLIHGLVDVPFFKNDLAFLTITLLAGIMFLEIRSKQEERLKSGV